MPGPKIPRALNLVGWFLGTLLVLLATQSALAATDGFLGRSSSGTINLSITKGSVVRISGLRDINQTFTGEDLSGSMDLCVYSSSGRYQVAAHGDAAQGAFALHAVGDPTGRPVRYEVFWNDSPFTDAGEVPVSAGSVLSGQAGADTSDAACQGGSTARVRLDIPADGRDGLAAAGVGAYAGTLTLVVTPD